MMTETVVNMQETPNNNSNNKPQHSDQPLGWIKVNVDYFKTTPAFVKIAELIFGIVCMSLASPAYASSTHFFLFVTTTSFIGTLIWVVIYFLGIREALNLPIHWTLTELINTGICTVFYGIASIIQIAIWAPYFNHYRHGENVAAGAFGIINTLVYAFGTQLLYGDYKRGGTI